MCHREREEWLPAYLTHQNPLPLGLHQPLDGREHLPMDQLWPTFILAMALEYGTNERGGGGGGEFTQSGITKVINILLMNNSLTAHNIITERLFC